VPRTDPWDKPLADNPVNASAMADVHAPISNLELPPPDPCGIKYPGLAQESAAEAQPGATAVGLYPARLAASWGRIRPATYLQVRIEV
jgi:hypothetical protein